MDTKGVEITWLGHAAVRFRTADGTTVLVDPWLEGNPVCPEVEHRQDRVDAIFITHGHFDHFGNTTALAAKHGSAVFSIHEIAVYLEGAGVAGVVGLNKGGTVAGPGGVHGTLVDAVHSSGISGADGIVDGGEPGGWILAFDGGPTVYHAGDTTVFGDMGLIGELYRPDIAFLPIGGHYTMGPPQAAHAARLIGANTVVPIHFGTFPILTGTPAELTAALAGSGIEVAEMDIGRPIG